MKEHCQTPDHTSRVAVAMLPTYTYRHEDAIYMYNLYCILWALVLGTRQYI